MNPDPLATEPQRLLEWERRALELDNLHVVLNHQEYQLRQILKARTLADVRKLVQEALQLPEDYYHGEIK